MLTKFRWWPFLRPLGPFKSFAKSHKTKYSHIWSKSISVMCCWCLDFSFIDVVDASTKGKQVIWTKAFHDLVQYFFVRNPVLSGTIIHSREMRQYNRTHFIWKVCVCIYFNNTYTMCEYGTPIPFWLWAKIVTPGRVITIWYINKQSLKICY